MARWHLSELILWLVWATATDNERFPLKSFAASAATSFSTMAPQHVSVVYLRQLAGWIINHNLTSSAESEMEFLAHFGLLMSPVLLLCRVKS